MFSLYPFLSPWFGQLYLWSLFRFNHFFLFDFWLFVQIDNLRPIPEFLYDGLFSGKYIILIGGRSLKFEFDLIPHLLLRMHEGRLFLLRGLIIRYALVQFLERPLPLQHSVHLYLFQQQKLQQISDSAKKYAGTTPRRLMDLYVRFLLREAGTGERFVLHVGRLLTILRHPPPLLVDCHLQFIRPLIVLAALLQTGDIVIIWLPLVVICIRITVLLIAHTVTANLIEVILASKNILPEQLIPLLIITQFRLQHTIRFTINILVARTALIVTFVANCILLVLMGRLILLMGGLVLLMRVIQLFVLRTHLHLAVVEHLTHGHRPRFLFVIGRLRGIVPGERQGTLSAGSVVNLRAQSVGIVKVIGIAVCHQIQIAIYLLKRFYTLLSEMYYYFFNYPNTFQQIPLQISSHNSSSINKLYRQSLYIRIRSPQLFINKQVLSIVTLYSLRYFNNYLMNNSFWADVKPIKAFGLALIITQMVVIILFISFVRMEDNIPADSLSSQRYPAFQDVNVMMLIGFGFLMTFIRTHSWSALSYTFFINAIVIELYILLKAFWQRIFHGFDLLGTTIKIDQLILTQSSYAVASVLIAFGAIIGRVGPRELLIVAVIQIFGYAFNEVLVLETIGAFDAGGSMTIHAFGAYFGLTASLILGKKVEPVSKPEADYTSNIFAMIGTLFLWLFWPSFNFGVFASTQFEQNQIVANTIMSLIGSCLSTFIVAAMFRNKFQMEDILNATLAGGVAIGSSAAILYYPGVSLVIGMTAGAISTFGFKYLSAILVNKFKLNDTCGIHNLHGIPGVFGGFVSALIVAGYNTGYDINVAAQYGPANIFASVHGTYINQAGLQIAGTLTSVGLGIVFGSLAGLAINFFYEEQPQQFYRDSYFPVQEKEVIDERKEKTLKLPSHEHDQNHNPLLEKLVEEVDEVQRGQQGEREKREEEYKEADRT